jgi:hypothetical protein
MKTSIQLMFFLLIITGSLYSQSNKIKNIDSNLNKDFSFPDDLCKDSKVHSFYVHTKGDSIIVQMKGSIFDLHEKPFTLNQDRIESYSDSLKEKQYPGSSRFYARSKIPQFLNQKSFVIKPNALAQRNIKNYLIIEDPILHKRIN